MSLSKYQAKNEYGSVFRGNFASFDKNAIKLIPFLEQQWPKFVAWAQAEQLKVLLDPELKEEVAVEPLWYESQIQQVLREQLHHEARADKKAQMAQTLEERRQVDLAVHSLFWHNTKGYYAIGSYEDHENPFLWTTTKDPKSMVLRSFVNQWHGAVFHPLAQRFGEAFTEMPFACWFVMASHASLPSSLQEATNRLHELSDVISDRFGLAIILLEVAHFHLRFPQCRVLMRESLYRIIVRKCHGSSQRADQVYSREEVDAWFEATKKSLYQ